MVLSQTAILEKIEKQLQERIQMKYGWRKKVKSTLLKMHKTFCHQIFARSNWNTRAKIKNLDLGVDQFGRSVVEGMLAYVELLRRRGFQVHTVVVLGSRAKGRWKPDSDVDVTAIISNVLKEEGFLGIKRWLLLSDRPIFMGIETSGCCSKKEFLCLLENFNLMALDAMYYGKVIYDDGFWIEVKERFQKMEKKYELQKIPLKKMLFAI
jgi:hypothetical protein